MAPQTGYFSEELCVRKNCFTWDMSNLMTSYVPHYRLVPISQVEVQTQVALWSDPIERTPVCSQTEITGSGRKFERTKVRTMVWSWSVQRSNWSEKSDNKRIWAHMSVIINGLSAIGSDQKYFWTQLCLIGNHFERPIFLLFCFFLVF